MDNQLKNVKTHARLLSKSVWYDWRHTLHSTLKEALLRTSEGLDSDSRILAKQETLLASIFPSLLRQAEDLELEEAELQLAAAELASCDVEELNNSRQQLLELDAGLVAKRKAIEGLKKELDCKQDEIRRREQVKQKALDDIAEAEKMREECRGWNSSEISTLKSELHVQDCYCYVLTFSGKVDLLEAKYGWTITGVSGSTISMTYLKEIELVFDASSFLSRSLSASTQSSASRIDLWYIAATRHDHPIPSTPEKDFLLQCTRDHIRSLVQSATPIKTLLSAVSQSWDVAKSVEGCIRGLRIICPTTVHKTGDSTMTVQADLLIRELTSKVRIQWALECLAPSDKIATGGINVKMTPSVKVVYGERFNESKMGDFLVSRCGDHVVLEDSKRENMSWIQATLELREKLIARGRK